jgi:transposase InsO family protein
MPSKEGRTMTDGRCRFGPRAKREMVARLLAGEQARAIARGMGCSPTTVTTVRDRWQQAGSAERADGSWCAPRRPVPRSCRWRLSVVDEQRILDARARTNWGPMRLQALTGRHRGTISRVLWRHGVSGRRRGTRQTFKRFEWAQPGALLHIDAYKAPKFLAPGHRVTGDRDQNSRPRGLGHTVVIAVQDDHTRLVYAELHATENAANVSVTLTRAASWMRAQGCGPLEAVMSDNAKCYTGHQFADALGELGARHIRIPPYTPRWNGKLERFFGTLEDEWAHGRVWPNSATRDRALSSFLRYFNRWRPHSAAGGRAPITRVQQDREQDN